MLWLILDNQKSPALVVDGGRVYAVAEVLGRRLSSINEDCNANEDDQDVDDPRTSI